MGEREAQQQKLWDAQDCASSTSYLTSLTSILESDSRSTLPRAILPIVSMNIMRGASVISSIRFCLGALAALALFIVFSCFKTIPDANTFSETRNDLENFLVASLSTVGSHARRSSLTFIDDTSLPAPDNMEDNNEDGAALDEASTLALLELDKEDVDAVDSTDDTMCSLRNSKLWFPLKDSLLLGLVSVTLVLIVAGETQRSAKHLRQSSYSTALGNLMRYTRLW